MVRRVEGDVEEVVETGKGTWLQRLTSRACAGAASTGRPAPAAPRADTLHEVASAGIKATALRAAARGPVPAARRRRPASKRAALSGMVQSAVNRLEWTKACRALFTSETASKQRDDTALAASDTRWRGINKLMPALQWALRARSSAHRAALASHAILVALHRRHADCLSAGMC